MAVNLICIRHGEAEHNVKGIVNWDGRKKFQLTEKGIKQATATAMKLRKEKVSAVFASPLFRCRMTAEIVNKYHKLPINIDYRIRDHLIGIFEGRKGEEFDKASEKDPLNFRPEGGETILEMVSRVEKFLDYLKKGFDNKSVIVVTHACIIKVMRHLCLNNDILFCLQQDVEKGKAYKLRF